jgi:glucokinase
MIGAVDIGGTKIAVGLVNAEGRILAQEVSPTAAEKGVDEGLERICAMLAACQAQVPGSQVTGVGVGCTGPVDPETGVLGPNSFLPLWEGIGMVDRLQSMTGVPVAIENDADAAALGEVAWGSGRGATHCIYVTVSTGIGCGIVVDSKLYRGVAGSHPELGHHVVDWNSGQQCYCGGRGCWESLASGPAMAAWYQSQSPAAELVDAREICRRAGAGEALALASIEREGVYLGIGLANLINAFVPQVIVLGGGVMQSWPLFSSQVQETIRQCCHLVPYEKTELRLASLGERTGLAGAARVWYHRFQPIHV